MNSFTAEIGYKSINHVGEELCGDHIDICENKLGDKIIVLADGLGSGVKASILSTLTSTILSKMMSAGLSVEECVETIALTLPICSVRGVAYSTFTIMHLINNNKMELIQYDNPNVIFIRDDKITEYARKEMNIGGKKIYRSIIDLKENDCFIAMSDGCVHAGIGESYNFGWSRNEIAEYMASCVKAGFTAKTLATMLVDQCNDLYGGKPGDDTTSCVVKIRRREPMGIVFGAPLNKDDDRKMMSLFFSKEGKHIVCGGTTSKVASNYLGKKIRVSLDYERSDVPPIAYIDGVDLVTEGVITMSKVLLYAEDYIKDNKLYEEWNYQSDGASQIARLLFIEATDISFYVGKAVNPAHQNPNLPLNFNIKMNIVEELSKSLKKMGKKVIVSYF